MWRNIFSPTRAAWLQHLPRLRGLRRPQRAHDMDNRLHTQGTLHPHNKALTNWVSKAQAELDAVESPPQPTASSPPTTTPTTDTRTTTGYGLWSARSFAASRLLQTHTT
jgi:hypothetical protein